MNKITITLLFLSMCFVTFGQEYIEQFDGDIEGQYWLSDGFAGSVENGEWTITGDGTAGAYSIFAYLPADGEGANTSVDVSGNNKIYVRVKASNIGTQLRLDLKDADGFVTSQAALTKFAVSNYTVYEFDFTDNFKDAGNGGAPCETGPCDVDPTKITEFLFFINPGQPNFAGTVILDFISVGSEPVVGPMSNVFQVHFDDPEDRGFILTEAAGYTNTVEDSNWKIKGDGTNGMWDVVSMLTFNPATKDTVDISLADGDNKLFVRMKSTVPGTSIRIDIQDINSFATTAGAITQVITEEYETYEFNYAGSYQDLAYGGTGCTEGGPACDVDPERIANMIFFINPGTEAFAGEVSIDYISVGTALEIDDINNELVYGDHFSETSDYVSSSGTYELGVENSILTIKGSGEDVAYSNIAYSLNDGEKGISINATGNNKVFIKARSTEANTLLRMDLLDSLGYATSQASLTRVLSTDFQVIEFNFSNQYLDGGYSGTSCETGTGPCEVDGRAINSIYLYPNPADGGFAGNIEIDYISFGKPLGEDVVEFMFVDQFEDGDISKISMSAGIEITESEGIMSWKGDGSSPAWGAMVYTPHNAETFEDYILDVTPTNKIYMKAKSTSPITLRMDLIDSDGYATTEPAVSVSISEEYQILEFDFTGTYMDGAYSGTPCTEETKPCTVDGTIIKSFSFFVEPGTGAFNGEVSIDWISTIDPLEIDTVDLGPVGIDDFAEEFTTNDLTFLKTREGNSLSAVDGILKITGDGTSGQYAPTSYTINDGTDSLIVNAANNDNKVFIRMKATTDTTTLRVDLNDNRNYHTTQAGLTKTLTTDFVIYEYDFTDKYKDGGYDGTACESGPCNVDGQRISHLQLYIDAGKGMYAGDLEIDWISFGEPLTSNVIETEVVNTAKVYPNPAEGEFYLELDAKVAGNMVANFIDISGRLVSTKSLGYATKGGNQKVVNVDNLVEGMYFLKITIANKEAFYQKVFVK